DTNVVTSISSLFIYTSTRTTANYTLSYTTLFRSIEVALPLLAFETDAGIDVVATNVAQRGDQTRNANGGEIEVMPHLPGALVGRSEEHTSELQSREKLVCRLRLEKKRDRRLH